MTGTAPPLPSRRPELLVDRGIVNDPRTGDYYNLGPQESFLLLNLDGHHSAAELAAAFESRFGSPLDGEDIDEFLDLARSHGLLDVKEADPPPDEEPVPPAGGTEAPPAAPLPARRADLVLRPSGDDGGHVVKDPRTGEFYNLGPEES